LQNTLGRSSVIAIRTQKERFVKRFFKEFKEFALGGNLVEVAVGLVLAIALGALIGSLVENIIMPIVAAIFSQPDFSELWRLKLRGSGADATWISLGTFVTALITFLSVAFAVYAFVLKPYNALKARIASGEEPAPAGPSEIDLLTEIRDSLAK
jgi:large conductance mechanosensitive channel